MALDVDLDFGRYIERRKGALEAQVREGAAYAYGGDLRIKKTLDSLQPVRLAIESTSGLWKSVARGELLGSAQKVTAALFPKIDALADQAAKALHIMRPAVYVSSELGTTQAQTLGTEEDAYIVLNGSAINRLTDSELLYVLAHECGHIQNGHVVLTTSLYYLVHAANRFVKWIVTPAVKALGSWARRAELTCDRAGLIAAQNLDTAEAVLLKLALAEKPVADLDTVLLDPALLDNVLEEVKGTRGTNGAPPSEKRQHGKLADVFAAHPYIEKRILALRIFADSAYYKSLTGGTGGLTQAEVDGKVGEVLR